MYWYLDNTITHSVLVELKLQNDCDERNDNIGWIVIYKYNVQREIMGMQYEEDMQKADIKHNNHTCTIQQSTQIYNHSNYMYL